MSTKTRVAIISGSLRKDSYNTQLVRFVANSLPDVEVDEISLSALNLPHFSEDLEAEEFPANAVDLKKRLIASDVILVASPEYNGSLSSALKNAIDWASRPREDEKTLACFQGKVGGLLSASPGGIGGLRGLRHVRQILTQLQMVVVPQEYALGGAHEAFDENGNMVNEQAATMAKAVGYAALEMSRKLKS